MTTHKEDNSYGSRCELNSKLARLLGWHVPQGFITGIPPESSRHTMIPLWTEDWKLCGELMGEHGCWPLEAYGTIDVYHEFERIACIEISEHEDKATAVRVAIVSAVIAKLERKKG